jgi:hypothetical protein
MRAFDLTVLSGLLAVGAAVGACSGSSTTAGSGDGGSMGQTADGASDDAGSSNEDGGGADGSSGHLTDGSQGGDAQDASTTGGDGALGGDSAAGGDGAAGVQCGPGGSHSFPTFDKHCSTDPDCALVVHILSCCGNVLVMAINKNAVTAFNAAESTCNSQYPACGCASNSVSFDDGVSYYDTSNPTQAAAARCINNSCEATFTGPTFACGSVVCAKSLNYCEMQGSDAGAPTSECVFTGPPTSDAGLTCSSFAVGPGCSCAESQGNPIVTCP